MLRGGGTVTDYLYPHVFQGIHNGICTTGCIFLFCELQYTAVVIRGASLLWYASLQTPHNLNIIRTILQYEYP